MDVIGDVIGTGADGVAEAAATAGTGAILAREAERIHSPGHDPSKACANCGTPLAGPYCAMCGQHGHVHRTAGALLHDLAHGVFHFEGRFWLTLPMLAWRPGELTRRYIHGERARFVSPIALFLFSVFLMFAVLGSLPGFQIVRFKSAADSSGLGKVGSSIAAERIKATESIARIERSLVVERASPRPDAGAIRDDERALAEAVKLRDSLAGAQRILGGPDPTAAGTPSAQDGWLARKWLQAKDNPTLLLYKLKTSAYKFSWALIPLSLPFIWLLFPLRRDVGLYDHAIFATYSLAFMSLFAVVGASLIVITSPLPPLSALLTLAAVMVPPIHLYRQIRGAYRPGRLGALWRTAWMVGFALVITPVFALFLLYVGGD